MDVSNALDGGLSANLSRHRYPDILLGYAVLVHAAGVCAALHVYEGFAQADYLKFYRTPESEQHFAELNAFLIDNLAK